MSKIVVGTILSVMLSLASSDVFAGEILLGVEKDKTSGQLLVQRKDGRFVLIPRGQWVTVDVTINAAGYWSWVGNGVPERSRGEPAFRCRVKRLKVYHHPRCRDIIWHCYDVN